MADEISEYWLAEADFNADYAGAQNGQVSRWALGSNFRLSSGHLLTWYWRRLLRPVRNARNSRFHYV